MLWEWRETGWGELSNIAGVIRIVVLAVTAASLFSLDLAFGILKLIPYGEESSSNQDKSHPGV